MSKILELRTKRNTLWEQTKDFLEKNRGDNGLVKAEAVELGFADEILFAKKEEEPDSDPADPENPEEDPDSEPGEGEEKKPFQKDTAGHLFSSRQMDLIVLNRLGVKPEDVGQKHTEPKEPTADPKLSAEPTPPAEPSANSGPVLDMDGKTEDGSIPYNILMKQLECMK